MKKTALFGTLAAACLAASAQSSVTVYGRINTTIESQKIGTAGRTTVVANNASRIGFKGTEDLGGGLSAGFALESAVHADDGTADASFWGRESSVQLKGAFGAIKLGNWIPDSYSATADYVSMHNHDTGSSADALYAFGTALPVRNKVAYFTPALGGFTGQVAMSAGEGQGKRIVEASGSYIHQGALHLGAGFSRQGRSSQYAGRALYFVGPLAIGGYLQHEKEDGSPYGESRNIYRLAAMYAVAASEFHLNFGGTQKGGTQAERARQYTLGYNHNLSKRTKVYGYYTALDSRSGTQDFDSLAIGIRHNF